MAASDFRQRRVTGNGKPRRHVRAVNGQHHVAEPDEHGFATNEPALIPQDELAERALLGSALIDEGALDACAFVKPQYFFRAAHQVIWRHMQELHADGGTADYVTLHDALGRSGDLDEIGGLDALMGLANHVPHSGHARHYARIVCEKYLARYSIRANAQLADASMRGDVQEIAAAWMASQTEMQEVFAALGLSMTGRAGGPRHQLLTLAQMRARPRPEWIIPGVLHERKRGLIFGDSNTGKSFVALDLGLSVATRYGWHGRAINRPGAVVYVCAEGADDIMTRVDAWLGYHGLDDAPNFWIVDDSPNLLELGDVSGLIARVNETLDEPPALVIFDTLAASMVGGDETTALDMGIVIGALHRVQLECQCGVLAVHHSGKDESKGPRGSSALRADVDVALRVTMDEATGIIAVNGDKWRSGDKRKLSFGFRLTPYAFDDHADLTSCILEATERPSAAAHTQPAYPRTPTPAATSGRTLAPDRLFALMQEIGKPLRDVEWKRLFAERGMGSEKTYEAAMAQLRRRHTVENVNGLWAAVGVL